VTYLKDRVVGLAVENGLVRRALLESGGALEADTLVNVANCWAAEICAMVGMALPVEPLRRQQFFFDTQVEVEPIPAMRHESGFAMRRLRRGFLSGYRNPSEAPGFNWDLEYQAFDDTVWPALAERSTAFDAIKMKSGWVGHYDMNRLDGNMILDRCPTVPNFIVAAGFSGHGVMHAPAVGRALKEMILDGGFQSIDLSRLSYRRVIDNTPLTDDGPTA
jgi:glycine/D-amino acid oxidase-like deaminating enzyme